MIKLIAITIAVIAISHIASGKELQKVDDSCVCYCPKKSIWGHNGKSSSSSKVTTKRWRHSKKTTLTKSQIKRVRKEGKKLQQKWRTAKMKGGARIFGTNGYLHI